MAKNYSIKLDSTAKETKPEYGSSYEDFLSSFGSDNVRSIVESDIKNRQTIAKEVAQDQEAFEADPDQDKKDKKSIDDIFAFDALAVNLPEEDDNNEDFELEYEERRRNAVAGLSDAVADLSSALIAITSLVETVLIKEN